jgi:hypothetical protein
MLPQYPVGGLINRGPGYAVGMADDDEELGAGMGTSATPNKAGAGAIDEPDELNAAPTGDVHTGGEYDDPDLPYERRPQPDDPNRRVP